MYDINRNIKGIRRTLTRTAIEIREGLYLYARKDGKQKERN